MPRITVLILLLVLLPAKAWSLEQYVILESGTTHASVNSDKTPEWFTSISQGNNSDTAFSILYGHDITEKLSLELGYSNLGDSIMFPLVDNKLVQEAKTFNFQARYRLGSWQSFSFSAHLGFARWRSKIYQQQPQPNLLIPSMSSIMLTNGLHGGASLKGDGFSTKAGLGVSYLISQSISFGIEYQHYRKIGQNAGLIDLDKLAIGDLAGSLKMIPAEVSLDIISANLTVRF